MDDEKKSEASGEQPERLGPYVLQEQVAQSDDSYGELYLATHETSGPRPWCSRSATCPRSVPGRRPRRSGSEGHGPVTPRTGVGAAGPGGVSAMTRRERADSSGGSPRLPQQPGPPAPGALVVGGDVQVDLLKDRPL